MTKKAFDVIMKAKPSRLIRKPGVVDQLKRRVNAQIRALSVDPKTFSENQDVVKKLNFLLESDLDTPQKQRWAIALLRYLDAKASGKLALGYKGKDVRKVKNLEINKLQLKIVYLRKQLEEAKASGNVLEQGKLERWLESAETNFLRLVEPIKQERERELEFSKLGKQLVVNDRTVKSDVEKNRADYDSAISFFDKKYLPYIEELVEETERYFGYQNANNLVSAVNLPYLRKYVDLQIALDKELTFESKMNLLEKELPNFVNSSFFHRVLNKLFFRFSQELKRLKLERGEHKLKDKLDLEDCLAEFERLKKIALSGEDVFLEEIIAIHSRKKYDIFFIHALRRTINSLPDPSNLSLNICKKVLGFLSFMHSFEDVRLDLEDKEEVYKRRVTKLEKERPKVKPVLGSTKTVGEFLFGVNEKKFDQTQFMHECLEELEHTIKDINLEDVIDIMIYLVKGACLFSNRRAIGGSYFPVEYFRSNVENALMSYHGDENPARARARIERITTILKKLNVIAEDRKLMSLKNLRDFESQSIRDFVDFATSIQRR